MPRYRDDRHLRVIEVWIVPARRLRIIHCDEKAGIVLVGDLISSKVEGVHADAMQWLFIIAPDFAAHPKPTAGDAHHYWFPGFDPGSWRGCHTRPSNPNSHLQPGGNGLREHDTLEQRPRAKVIRSVFVHPTCPTSHDAFSGLTSVLPTWTKPLARRTLRVRRTEKLVADVVWVTEKGDSCDPFTPDDAGGTPASQLFCDHYAQLPASGDRIHEVFWQVPRQAWPQRTSKLASLSTDRTQADARYRRQRCRGTAILFHQDA